MAGAAVIAFGALCMALGGLFAIACLAMALWLAFKRLARGY